MRRMLCSKVRVSCNMWQQLSSKMQQYTVYLYLQTALHVSDGISTHHQELMPLYLQYLTLLRPLLLPVVNVTGLEQVPIQVAVTVSLMSDTVDTVIWAPDDGWRYHPKHVEQFADINKLYIVACCWIIIARNEKNCYQSSRFRSSGLFTFSINSAESTLQTSSRIPWQVTVAVNILACNGVMPDSNISQDRKYNLRFLKVLLNRSEPMPGFRPRLFVGRFLPNPFQTHLSRYNSILCTLRFWERRKINHWGNSLVVESIECKSRIWTGWRKGGRNKTRRRESRHHLVRFEYSTQNDNKFWCFVDRASQYNLSNWPN